MSNSIVGTLVLNTAYNVVKLVMELLEVTTIGPKVSWKFSDGHISGARIFKVKGEFGVYIAVKVGVNSDPGT